MNTVLFDTFTIDMLVAFFVWLAGYLWTGKYVQPAWKQIGKFAFYIGLTAILSWTFGHWSLLFAIPHQLLGHYFHIQMCRKHGINWITLEPIEDFLKLKDPLSKKKR